MGNEALQFLHERIGEYVKGHCTQEEGEYNCSPRAIALYKFLESNPCYTKENPCKLDTLEQVLGYFTRDDKGAHDKCRAILDDILEINNSGKWEGVICTDRRNGYWLSHSEGEIQEYLDFYLDKMCKAALRAYTVKLKLDRAGQCKTVSNSYEPKPITDKHEQYHDPYKREPRMAQGSIFGDGIIA